ncbi:MAG: hypothetical protein SGI77_08910 [Pirellulaceae bacterium]|nr:hypothetical protein [Pirellulaceae bacterium]
MNYFRYAAVLSALIFSSSHLVAAPPTNAKSTKVSNNPYDQLLSDATVRKNIGIDEQTYSKLRDAFGVGELDTKLSRSQLAELAKVPINERPKAMEKLRSSYAKASEQTMADVKEILSPDQFFRLEQIKLQVHLLRDGVYKAVATTDVGKEIDISESQKAKIREIEASEFALLAKEIMRLRREAIERILASSLDSSQQKMLDDLLGTPFLVEK